jgi:hypothetical protein
VYCYQNVFVFFDRQIFQEGTFLVLCELRKEQSIVVHYVACKVDLGIVDCVWRAVLRPETFIHQVLEG